MGKPGRPKKMAIPESIPKQDWETKSFDISDFDTMAFPMFRGSAVTPFVRITKDSVKFTMALSNRAKDGCQIDDLIKFILLVLKTCKNRYGARQEEIIYARNCLEQALYWLTVSRMSRNRSNQGRAHAGKYALSTFGKNRVDNSGRDFEGES